MYMNIPTEPDLLAPKSTVIAPKFGKHPFPENVYNYIYSTIIIVIYMSKYSEIIFFQ